MYTAAAVTTGAPNPAVDRSVQDRLFGTPDGRKDKIILADFGGN